jgi:cysteine desulfurase family protein (TIGR01976 family)
MIDGSESTGVHEALRAITPSLHNTGAGLPRVFLDAPSGTQMPQPVLDSMVEYIQGGMANRGGVFPTSLATEELLLTARQKTKALLGATEYEIIFGQNMTSLAFAAAASIRRSWERPLKRGSRVVVSELDHHANIDPWREIAKDAGYDIAWLPVDPETYTHDLRRLDEIVDEDCRLVAAALSSNAVGTINSIDRIVRRAKEMGAISVVDAVHGLSHVPVEIDAWGADMVLFSTYKIYGPHLGAMAIRRELLEKLNYYKLAPAPISGPSRAEQGTQNMEALAGWNSAMDLIASCGGSGAYPEKLRRAIGAFAAHEDKLTRLFVAGLSAIPGVVLARAPSQIAKTSTVAFNVSGKHPGDVAKQCAKDAVYITNGDFYATTLSQRTGVAERGGWLRIGIAAYHNEDDIRRALSSIEKAIQD